MNAECIAPVAKFRDYVFKPGAMHGKDRVFRSLGYTQEDAEMLAALYEEQAAAKYSQGDYELGRLDEHGQRITIEIELTAKEAQTEKISHLATGWMVQADGSLRLNTPFTGFTR